MKKPIAVLLSLMLIFTILCTYVAAEEAALPVDTDVDNMIDDGANPGESTEASSSITPPEVKVPAAILMDGTTGQILFSQNETTPLPPASVTKIMTLLLVIEDLSADLISLTDKVTISSYAASMGGSQVFLAEGEVMALEDLLKCTIIASANDAAVALAEYVSGSEETFVARMNARAQELGATTAHFENATGLDDDTTNHVMSALDIAIISRELIKHEKILEYSSVWMDSIRDGEFTLTNTNRLVRYYDGATGLKTGSTDKAKFCMTATAERNNMPLIAVVMGAESRDARNNAAKTLLDWGYANYALYCDEGADYGSVQVKRGCEDYVLTHSDGISVVIPKEQVNKVEKRMSLTPFVTAKIENGCEVGTISYLIDGEVIGTVPIYASNGVSELTLWSFIGKMMKIFTLS